MLSIARQSDAHHSIEEIGTIAGDSVTLLGNIPPRDVLASGSPAEVEESVRNMISSVSDHRRIIWSCGGGMPPDVSTENIRAFVRTVKRMNQ